jgi:uncharacterized protein (TIGR01244 family)
MTAKILPTPLNAACSVLILAAAVACAAPDQNGAAAAVATEATQRPAAATAAVALTDLLPNGLEPLPGVVVGGQPTLAQLDEAASRGLRTVINLRTAGESAIGRAEIEARGMAYVELPIAGVEDLTPANAAALDRALATAEHPVMVHCGSGNRVGALLALRARYIEGASAEEALRFGREAGLTRLEAPVREILAADEGSVPPGA